MISWALKQQQHNVSSANMWLTWPFQSHGSFAIDVEEKRAEQSVCYAACICLFGVEFQGFCHRIKYLLYTGDVIILILVMRKQRNCQNHVSFSGKSGFPILYSAC